MLRPVADKDGYLRVTVAGQKAHVAVLVLEAFVGPAPEGTEACHWPDPDRTCNVLSNLRWASHQENEQDKRRLIGMGHRPDLNVTPVTAGAADE